MEFFNAERDTVGKNGMVLTTGCVIVRDGLVHSEGLSVYPRGVGWIVGGITKVGMACSIQGRGLYLTLDLLVLIFRTFPLTFPWRHYLFSLRLAHEPCGSCRFPIPSYGT